MGHACCRPPQLRFVGLHFSFLSYTQSFATTWLHSGLLYFRPAFAGLLCSAGIRPRDMAFSPHSRAPGGLCHPHAVSESLNGMRVQICFFFSFPRAYALV